MFVIRLRQVPSLFYFRKFHLQYIPATYVFFLLDTYPFDQYYLFGQLQTVYRHMAGSRLAFHRFYKPAIFL